MHKLHQELLKAIPDSIVRLNEEQKQKTIFKILYICINHFAVSGDEKLLDRASDMAEKLNIASLSWIKNDIVNFKKDSEMRLTRIVATCIKLKGQQNEQVRVS